jgi:hypothetical protein
MNTVTFTISDQACFDILTTAWEGGIDYWVGEDYRAYPSRNERLDVTMIHIVDSGEGVGVMANEIGPAQVAAAISRILDEQITNHEIREDIVRQDLRNDCGADANTADAIVQIACFGEIVYG